MTRAPCRGPGSAALHLAGGVLEEAEGAEPRVVDAAYVAGGGRERAFDRRHRRHRGADVRKGAAGDGAEDRGAEQDRLLGRVARTGRPVASARSWRTSGWRPAPPLIAIASTGAPLRGLGLDDLAQAVAEAAEAGDVERDQLSTSRSMPSPAMTARACGIGEGRAVAEELGHDVDARRRVARRRTGRRRAAARSASQSGSDCPSAAARSRGLGARPDARRRDGRSPRPRRTGRPRSARRPGSSPRSRAPRRRGRRPGRVVVVIVQDEVPKT